MAVEPQMLRYNALDSCVTLACHDAIFDEVERTGYHDTYSLTERLLPVLLYMSSRGIKVDREELEKKRHEVTDLINQKQAALDQMIGKHLDVNSPKACQSYFYGVLGIPPYTKTSRDAHGNRKTSITTDDKAMARIARGTASRNAVPAARLVQELRGLIKLRGTYLEVEFDSDQRLRCSINPRGTRFGRLSTSKTIFGTGTNMQNLPPAFKTFLVADEGCMFYELDKARAEWVVVAYLSGDANMIAVCEQKLDPHLHTAHQMYGVDKEVITMENDLIGHETGAEEITRLRSKFERLGIDTSKWPRTMSMRQAGKKSNHGLNYDEGFRTFALTNEIMEDEAKRMISLYHSGYPNIRQWHDSIQSQLRHDRTLQNCFGRKYKFLEQWGSDLFKSAYAFLPQSTVVDLLNESLIRTYNDPSPHLSNTEILMQVHDSSLNQFHGVDFRQWAKAITLQVDHMNPTLRYGGREFGIDTDLKIGLNWGNMHTVSLTGNLTELEDRLEHVTHELRATV